MVTAAARRIVLTEDAEEQRRKLDALWERVLSNVAAGTCRNPDACAAEALSVLHVVTRWFA